MEMVAEGGVWGVSSTCSTEWLTETSWEDGEEEEEEHLRKCVNGGNEEEEEETGDRRRWREEEAARSNAFLNMVSVQTTDCNLIEGLFFRCKIAIKKLDVLCILEID